ncbi:DMT family transporter [Eggerthellaceae bacterium zg-997]|nr:DMT family transporter [Eggerthellaceae bacterium zg-997]
MRPYALLVAATLIWGSTFVLVKDVTAAVPPSWLVGIRFTCATAVLAVCFLKRRALYLDRGTVRAGLACGLALFCAYYLQTWGITDTTPGKNAFLTATYCVIVPFLAWATLRRRPTRYSLMGAACALAGVGLISLGGGVGIRTGDALTLAGALFFALHIVLVARFTRACDPYVLTMWQFAGVGVCGLTVALISEPMPTWSALEASDLATVAYLTVFATTVALLLQNVAQSRLAPATASLILTFESVFGVVFSVIMGAEQLTGRLLAGFALIFASVLIAEVLPAWLQKRRTLQGAGPSEPATAEVLVPKMAGEA